MSFHLMTSIGWPPSEKRSAIAFRASWSPSFSSRWTSIQYFSRPLKPRRLASASWSCSHCLTMIAACWTATARGRLDAVQDERVRRLLDVVEDVVERADQGVDVLAIEGRDEGRLEAVADLVADLVAAVLGVADLAGPLLRRVVRRGASPRTGGPRRGRWRRPRRTGRRSAPRGGSGAVASARSVAARPPLPGELAIASRP